LALACRGGSVLHGVLPFTRFSLLLFKTSKKFNRS
jgi:hypothetical protein